jgi:hypothetical protein
VGTSSTVGSRHPDALATAADGPGLPAGATGTVSDRATHQHGAGRAMISFLYKYEIFVLYYTFQFEINHKK